MKTLGLYIHIPFCARKCNYCDFYSITPKNKNTTDDYLKSVKSSLSFWKKKLDDYIIDTVYLGGGTPSLLSTDDINSLLNNVYSCFNVSSDAEITIEVNPNSVVNLDLQSLKTNGINRISMGLQSIKDDELKILGRLHSASNAQHAIDVITKSGIHNFSLDVMLGIPLQTADSLTDTLDFCIASGATHISTYMLKIEENTPFFQNKENLIFADNDTVADLYDLTCKKLALNEFRHYEISNFCRNNLISRHNMKYWELDDYLGIGPSAHSLINGKRFFYPRSLEVFKNNEINFESEGNTAEEYIMLSLRTDKGFNIDKYRGLFSKETSDEFNKKSAILKKAGLLNINERTVTLTEKGYLVSNAIISELIEALI